MFRASDTAWGPWYVADTDDKRRGRLNVISHFLSLVPYTPLAPRDVHLPKQRKAHDAGRSDLTIRHVPLRY